MDERPGAGRLYRRAGGLAGLRPQVFLSYARHDREVVGALRDELVTSFVDCWMDTTNIVAGARLSPTIEEAIGGSTLFFSYVTEHYLASRWCLDELAFALRKPGLVPACYVDSPTTLAAIPEPLRQDVFFGLLDPDRHRDVVLEVTGRAWASLQSARRLVPADSHILAGPEVFDTAGFSRLDLMARTRRELVLAGQNLRSWLSDRDTRDHLVALVRDRGVRVTFVLATYATLRPMAAEGAIHLRESARDLQRMLDQLDERQRELMSVFFHPGAATLSAVFVDPTAPDGLLIFNPRWAIQFLPQDRLTCVIDKTVNSDRLFKALYNGILLMTQGDALRLPDMLAPEGT